LKVAAVAVADVACHVRREVLQHLEQPPAVHVHVQVVVVVIVVVIIIVVVVIVVVDVDVFVDEQNAVKEKHQETEEAKDGECSFLS